MILMSVSQKWPILLHGPPGAGKTALINRLAEMSENQGTQFMFFKFYSSIHQTEKQDLRDSWFWDHKLRAKT